MRLYKTVRFALITIIVLFFAFPIVWLVASSLLPGYKGVYVFRTVGFTLENFHKIWDWPGFRNALKNAVIIATIATFLSLIITLPSGYVLGRFKDKFSKSWFTSIYIVRTIPFITWVLPLFLLYRKIGLYDTYQGLILPHLACHLAFFSLVIKGYFEAIDLEIEDAAQIDGCSRWGAFFHVSVPLALPAIISLAVLCWMWAWNEFFFALMLTSYRVPMLTVILIQGFGEYRTDWEMMSAGAVLGIAPAFIVTIVAAKHLIKGLAKLGTMAK